MIFRFPKVHATQLAAVVSALLTAALLQAVLLLGLMLLGVSVGAQPRADEEPPGGRRSACRRSEEA